MRSGKLLLCVTFGWTTAETTGTVSIADWPHTGQPPEIFFVPSKIVDRALKNPKSQREWFWMSEDEAARYSGVAGYKLLAAALAARKGRA